MKRLMMALMVAMLFMAVSAQAEESKPYFALSGGATFTGDLDFPGINVSFNPGYNVGGALGFAQGPIRIEGEITYRSVNVDKVNGGAFPSTDLSMFSVMANGYYDFDLNSAVTPYFGAGFGYVGSDLDVSGFGSDSKSDFGYQVMVGLGYAISPTTSLTGGYRYFAIVDSGMPDSHEFVFGARFMF